MRRFSYAHSYLVTLLTVALAIVLTQSAHAQTFNVLHTFTTGLDGGEPYAGLTMDKAGNLYGTASEWGAGYGTVYKLKHSGSNWIFNTLYSFAGGSDGGYPYARVIVGPNGILYGTTAYGGTGSCGDYGCGNVFNLRPPPGVCKSALCPSTETGLYSFAGGADGAKPLYGDVVFDQVGNLYGTTSVGGNRGNCDFGGQCGTVYELRSSNGGWTESLLYTFAGGSDGAAPYAGVIFDKVGNLYGTASLGGDLSCTPPYGCGTVFELTPSNGGWTESVLYTFTGGSDGAAPYAGLIFDKSGNLYGATMYGGQGGGGTVFKLTPSGGSWTFSLVYSFTGGCGPAASLVMDGAGNLYGTRVCGGGIGGGTVFKLTPSGGNWTYTSLHDFTGGSDGADPYCTPVFDANGNIYGTTSAGGDRGVGVVFEITP